MGHAAGHDIDPTFYRSPADAISAPPEQLAYVVVFDRAAQQPDASGSMVAPFRHTLPILSLSRARQATRSPGKEYAAAPPTRQYRHRRCRDGAGCGPRLRSLFSRGA